MAYQKLNLFAFERRQAGRIQKFDWDPTIYRKFVNLKKGKMLLSLSFSTAILTKN